MYTCIVEMCSILKLKNALVKSVLQHKVHHFQFCLIIVVTDLTVHKRVYFLN